MKRIKFTSNDGALTIVVPASKLPDSAEDKRMTDALLARLDHMRDEDVFHINEINSVPCDDNDTRAACIAAMHTLAFAMFDLRELRRRSRYSSRRIDFPMPKPRRGGSHG